MKYIKLFAFTLFALNAQAQTPSSPSCKPAVKETAKYCKDAQKNLDTNQKYLTTQIHALDIQLAAFATPASRNTPEAAQALSQRTTDDLQLNSSLRDNCHAHMQACESACGVDYSGCGGENVSAYYHYGLSAALDARQAPQAAATGDTSAAQAPPGS